MSKIDVVRAAMVEAMKAKDKQRKDALSMLLSALKNFEIDKKDHEPITEDEANTVVKKEIKQSPVSYTHLFRPFFTTRPFSINRVK